MAGGAIAGVLIGFLSFGDTIPKVLSVWQYRQVASAEARSLNEWADEEARNELGLSGRTDLSAAEQKELDGLAEEIKEMNGNLLPQYARVPRGTVLKLPKQESYTAERDLSLGEVAAEVLGSREKARLLFEDNRDRLTLPPRLPAGASLRVPQTNPPALIAFGVLVFFLILVGLGIILRSPKPTTNETNLNHA